ncbi:hypothetical protein [Nostoc sp. T09]|uniref:hypothetical protein n=1 Tax=Nostoc sp. T09 TaxID=1932621 RepID=UPI00117E5AAB|nr:hypothetical protein [Nostoc sp. T09]
MTRQMADGRWQKVSHCGGRVPRHKGDSAVGGFPDLRSQCVARVPKALRWAALPTCRKCRRVEATGVQLSSSDVTQR